MQNIPLRWLRCISGLAVALASLGGLGADLEPSQVRTQHAQFLATGFSSLPDWQFDDSTSAWDALMGSCQVLGRRATWSSVCAKARRLDRRSEVIRAFFEETFVPLQILNPDSSREGVVTGYFEPLLIGRTSREPGFEIPVHGIPDDLVTLDWTQIPRSQRNGVVWLKREGARLLPTDRISTGAVELDLRGFVLDTKDRNLRARLVPSELGVRRALPYHTRAELISAERNGSWRAPVLAWVGDALALYSMQIQGSGRIRLPSGDVLRLQFGEHNGQPFKPLRVVAKPRSDVRTRSLSGTDTSDGDEFEIEADPSVSPATAASVVDPDEPVTRGLRSIPRARPSSRSEPSAGEVDSLVSALLSSGRQAEQPKVVQSKAGKSSPVDLPNSAQVSTPKPNPPIPIAREISAVSEALLSDPSYVFFRVASNQSSTAGPPGAMGVPLTPRRSVAIDPRVTPLGYPVYLDAPRQPGSQVQMRGLVMAQDTGGAIRGAVRADFFWGFGSEAGQLARGTRHTGRMWLLMPRTEWQHLSASAIRSRSLGAPVQLSVGCLVQDEYCTETD